VSAGFNVRARAPFCVSGSPNERVEKQAMAKDQAPENVETISAAAEAPAGQQVQVQIDESKTQSDYSTTVRVWGSAEEINLDFAGPIRPAGPQTARLKIERRVVMNPWAAKRLAIALGQAVAQYEKAYGTLELDQRKRRVDGSAGG
jgi:hypothetical protein